MSEAIDDGEVIQALVRSYTARYHEARAEQVRLEAVNTQLALEVARLRGVLRSEGYSAGVVHGGIK